MTAYPPGSTIAVLGDGQLGRMLAVAAKDKGYRVLVCGASEDSPAGQIGDVFVQCDFASGATAGCMDALSQADVVTYETENLPLGFVQELAQRVPVRPTPKLLGLSQHRWTEKSSLEEMGLPVTAFRAIQSARDLDAALVEFGGRGVLKTTMGGYDGKGQWMLREPTDAEGVRSVVEQVVARSCDPDRPALILEALVDFELEFSLVVARSVDGEVASYGPIVNDHKHHILDVSVCPGELGEGVAQDARRVGKELADGLGVVGLFCIEFFLCADGSIKINEVAPRPHNSGHLTIEAHATSQFEQQLRAVCGLSLGSVQQRQPAAMLNLLGDLWFDGNTQTEPVWDRVRTFARAHLHLYGKKDPRPKRKMGHITVLADAVDELQQGISQLRAILTR